LAPSSQSQQLAAAASQLQNGCFELYGCDFILEEDKTNNGDHDIFLLEINSNPAISCDTKVLQHIIPPTVKESVDIVEAAHWPKKGGSSGGGSGSGNIIGQGGPGGGSGLPFGDTSLFEVLIDESRNFQWKTDLSRDL